MSDASDDIEELLRAAEAAEAAASATLPTAEEERVIIDAAEKLAGGDAGVPAKSRAAVLRLETKWLDFLQRHGAEYKWDASVGPMLVYNPSNGGVLRSGNRVAPDEPDVHAHERTTRCTKLEG